MFRRWPKIGGCEYNALGEKPSTREEAMKQYLGLGLGMIAGSVIGAAAISGLHAQAKPPVYAIIEINEITDAAAYKAVTQRPNSATAATAQGARYISRGGKITSL